MKFKREKYLTVEDIMTNFAVSCFLHSSPGLFVSAKHGRHELRPLDC
jgi:hypothetical protein